MAGGPAVTLKQILAVVEIRTKLVSISTFATATIYALRETGRLDPLVLGLTFPAVLFVDMGTTAFNSFFDYWRGVDRGPRLQEADKVLVTEGVPALAAFFVAPRRFFVAACLGLVLALRPGAWVIGWGALCIGCGLPVQRGASPDLPHAPGPSSSPAASWGRGFSSSPTGSRRGAGGRGPFSLRFPAPFS